MGPGSRCARPGRQWLGSSEEPTCGCGKRSRAPFPCFRPVLYRERRTPTVPSRRGAVRRSHASWHVAPVFFLVICRSGRAAFGGSGVRTRFARAGRRDSMPAEPKPRTAMSTQTIIVERRGRVGIVRLNRPQALNALNVTLKDELLSAVEAFDADADVGCILMTGSDKAFAAGADIKEMADQSYIDIFRADYTADYERLARVRKPIIAAVAGFALGGGCELAMMCDLIIAADNAKFGQPEIKLGVIPGIGGTQRLARAVGK